MFEFLIGAVVVIVAGLFAIAWLIAPAKKVKNLNLKHLKRCVLPRKLDGN